MFVVAKVLRSCRGWRCGVVDESDVFVVERFDEMLLRRWRGDVVVGVVEMWLFQNNDSKKIMADSKITARLHE